jgi:hypothetical protein
MARGRSIAPRSQAATGRALVSSARGCNVCTARADVAQLVEQRFVIQERVFFWRVFTALRIVADVSNPANQHSQRVTQNCAVLQPNFLDRRKRP